MLEINVAPWILSGKNDFIVSSKSDCSARSLFSFKVTVLFYLHYKAEPDRDPCQHLGWSSF